MLTIKVKRRVIAPLFRTILANHFSSQNLTNRLSHYSTSTNVKIKVLSQDHSLLEVYKDNLSKSHLLTINLGFIIQYQIPRNLY